MKKKNSRPVLAFFAVACALLLAGCAIGPRERHSSSSVVDYLYPETKEPVKIEPSIPTLALPLRVGIAFVPGYDGIMTERDRTDLLNQVAENFKNRPYVKSIEVIPSPYLKRRGGFANLDQIKTMYGIDVIALVSLDQVQFTDSNFLSITYWSIVGAYIIPAEKNDTHTMLDTVVYDIASRAMLFRAPGTSHIKGHATPMNLSEQLRLDGGEGLQLANKEMIANLETQLAAFREKVKAQPSDYRVVHRPGYSGGGAVDTLGLALFAAGAAALLSRRKTD